MVNRLWTGWPGFRNPTGTRNVFPLQEVHTGPGFHLSSHLIANSFPERRRWCSRLTTHLHIVLSLWICGVIYLLPLHALMVCTGTTLPLPLPLLFYFKTYLAWTKISLNFYLTSVRVYRWQVSNYSDECVSILHKDIICIQAEDSCCDYNPTYSHLRSRMVD
jgi:hypothetical protein